MERPAIRQWIIRRRHGTQGKSHRFRLELSVRTHHGMVRAADPERAHEEHHRGEHRPDVVEDLVGGSYQSTGPLLRR